ncbi:glutamine--fructose-6-phosphate transaminase (isomerizing) [Halarsenatibacter silvermanii]|uniref:Glutamine--fructose-6-phosphate aminotransferase [isomerizing] n=1 Tax=Halarsenatibacter silvermanii TaxID=321763 RepID=A0A1G9GX77_9FIRM|nr:glutamine--fructose-6-phosphate transaminase (isomerizing) [Halarsenatibacter silvermanii]SDL04863.1 glucosamine--fructose-6-phosphate aminotransferase (isomerizing) [Halarsenatibacter silvermanii]
MCGIVGYAGKEQADEFLLAGLKRLEYRGYDSAGIATLGDECVNVIKCKGSLDELEDCMETDNTAGEIGIGHTRWATHGVPADCNAHPHQGCEDRFALVHNGIIENYQKLKQDLLERGHKFDSETDTEVLAHLLEEEHESDVLQAMRSMREKIEGSYALAVVDREDSGGIYVLRQASPLVIGEGEDANFLASDIPALLEYTKDFYVLEDGDMAVIDEDEIDIYPGNGQAVEERYFHADWDAEMVEKQGYEHFMLKEIHEQPTVARRFLSDRLKQEEVKMPELEEIWQEDFEKVMITACGTAYYSGQVGRHIIEELARLPVDVEIASELRYKQNFIDEDTLVIVVSQSGETADTLAALEVAQKKGAKILALTNTASSSIARQSDAVVDIMAGPEIAVASTKAYLAMLLGFYLLGLKLAELRGTLSQSELSDYRREILKLPDRIESTLHRTEPQCQKLAETIVDYDSIFFIGRNLDYSLALEGALKLKEISYIHAESYPAGELKHGTLALVEEGVPVFALMTRGKLARKTLSNVEEVKARGGRVIAVASSQLMEERAEDEFYELIKLPVSNELWAGVIAVIPLQLTAYYAAKELDCSIDKPRNLAKSVTVE